MHQSMNINESRLSIYIQIFVLLYINFLDMMNHDLINITRRAKHIPVVIFILNYINPNYLSVVF
jgi:hypothetical protein